MWGAFNMKRQEERHIQIQYVQWLRIQYPNVITIISPIVKFGGTMKQRLIQGYTQKMMGYMKGTLDIFLPHPKKEYHGLFIELKSLRGRISKEQILMVDALSQKGYAVYVCSNLDDAINFTKGYLD
jgi:hypothetical protein